MSNRIRETLYAQTANDGSTIYVVANIDCDTAADLPAVNAFTGLTLLMGSRAHDIDQNAWYEMQDGGTWILQDAGTAAYTKAETDALLATKENLLTFDATPTSGSQNPVYSGGVFTAISNFITLSDVFGIGSLIPDNSDLNNYLTGGKYYGGNSAGNSCTNLPVPNGTFHFSLVVKQVTPSATLQYIKVCNLANDPYIFIRRRTTSTWQSWYRFEGTQVI